MSEDEKAEFWNALMADKNEKNARWADALGLATEAEEDPANPGPPDFDAGARESAPVPTDPNKDHAELILELLNRDSRRLT